MIDFVESSAGYADVFWGYFHNAILQSFRRVKVSSRT
jgi:hypothetical protein